MKAEKDHHQHDLEATVPTTAVLTVAEVAALPVANDVVADTAAEVPSPSIP